MSGINYIEDVSSDNLECLQGQLADGRVFIFRNMYGHSAVRVSSLPADSPRAAKNGITVYESRHADGIRWGPGAVALIVAKSVKIWDKTVARSDCEVYA